MVSLHMTVNRLPVDSGRGKLTVPVATAFKLLPRASTPTIVAISWTSLLVSFAFVDAERSWLSFARAHGWLEMCTFDGSADDIMKNLQSVIYLMVAAATSQTYIVLSRRLFKLVWLLCLSIASNVKRGVVAAESRLIVCVKRIGIKRALETKEKWQQYRTAS